jgi:hypothetical protein
MERREQNGGRRPFLITHKIISMSGRAMEGDNQGIVEVTEVTDITEEGTEETEITRFSYCGGCYRVIQAAEQISGRCVECGAVLCQNCGQVVCSNEHCQKTVCPSCRDTWSGQVYCHKHSREEFLKRFIAFSILASFIGITIFLLLRIVS